MSLYKEQKHNLNVYHQLSIYFAVFNIQYVLTWQVLYHSSQKPRLIIQDALNNNVLLIPLACSEHAHSTGFA